MDESRGRLISTGQQRTAGRLLSAKEIPPCRKKSMCSSQYHRSPPSKSFLQPLPHDPPTTPTRSIRSPSSSDHPTRPSSPCDRATPSSGMQTSGKGGITRRAQSGSVLERRSRPCHARARDPGNLGILDTSERKAHRSGRGERQPLSVELCWWTIGGHGAIEGRGRAR
jgi:hypothetical protein